MLSGDIIQNISNWSAWACKPDVQRYDVALLKIWIQFERFLGDLFISYALGNASEKGYSPKLKIRFQDEEQFNALMRQKGKNYVEYLDRIESLSPHIFVDNPFDILLSDANIKTSYEQMKAIRNYIAHESGEAKSKLINKCFNGNDSRFVEPNDYLQTREKSTKDTFYTYYVKTIENVVNLLISPAGTGIVI